MLNWNASIFLASKSSVHSSTFTSSVFIHVIHHMSALDQLKHSCTINEGGSSFPERWCSETVQFVKNLICKLLAVFISLTIMGWLNLLTKFSAHGCIFVEKFLKFRWAYRIYNLTLFLWIHKAALKVLPLRRKESPYHFCHRPKTSASADLSAVEYTHRPRDFEKNAFGTRHTLCTYQC